MKIRSILACSALVCGAAITVIGPSQLVRANVPALSSTAIAQQADLNLVGEGEGTLSISNRPSQTVPSSPQPAALTSKLRFPYD
jgi:high-affinity K+ transport system ATPase subunit B